MISGNDTADNPDDYLELERFSDATKYDSDSATGRGSVGVVNQCRQQKQAYIECLMAHFSQMRIVGTINSCMLVGGCRDRFLMRTPYRTLDRRRFGMRIDGRDAARSFCLLRFSFAALCLSASSSQLALITDERQLFRSEASCCHD